MLGWVCLPETIRTGRGKLMRDRMVRCVLGEVCTSLPDVVHVCVVLCCVVFCVCVALFMQRLSH